MSKTITATFDTIDLAELAAKTIKNNFEGIKAITIKYQNFPHTGNTSSDHQFTDSIGANFAGVVSPAGSYPVSGGIAAAPIMYHMDSQPENAPSHDHPEIQDSTESRLIIKAREDEIQAISARLRSMGGREIM
ncbi:MAG: hypothetical protein ACOX60_07810 [Massiliimalia sp.]